MSSVNENRTFEEYGNFMKISKERTWTEHNILNENDVTKHNNNNNNNNNNSNYNNTYDKTELEHISNFKKIITQPCRKPLGYNNPSEQTHYSECFVNDTKGRSNTNIIYKNYNNYTNNNFHEHCYDENSPIKDNNALNKTNIPLCYNEYPNYLGNENKEIQENETRKDTLIVDRDIQNKSFTKIKENYPNFTESSIPCVSKDPSITNNPLTCYAYEHENKNNENVTSYVNEPNKSFTNPLRTVNEIHEKHFIMKHTISDHYNTNCIDIIDNTSNNNNNNITLTNYCKENYNTSVEQENEKEKEKEFYKMKEQNDFHIIERFRNDINKTLDENDMLLHAINEHLENGLLNECIPLFEHVQQNLFVLSILAKQPDAYDSSDDDL